MIKLSWSMVLRHKVHYIGLAVTIAIAALLLGASLSLRNSSQHPAVSAEGQRPSEIEALRQLAESSAWFTNLMAWLTALITLWIVAQTMGFILSQRRKELAQILLVGASKTQLYLMIINEAVTVSFFAACLGVLTSPLLIQPYSKLLILSNNGSSDIPYSSDLSALIVSVGLIVFSTGLGAFFSVRKIASLSLVEAVRAPATADRRRLSAGRLIMAILGFGVLIFTFLPAGDSLGYQLSTLLTAAGVIVVIVSLAPLLVPSVAQLIGKIISPMAPGPAQIAREYTRLSPLRTASLATPLILLLCLVSVFAMLAQTGRAETYAQSTQLKNTDYLVSSNDMEFRPENQTALEKNQDIAQSTTLITAPDWTNPESKRAISLVGITPETIENFIPVSVRAGDLAMVDGDRVASFTGQLGDRRTIQSPNGQQKVVEVVAAVDSNFFIRGDYLVNERSFDLSENIVDTQMFAQSSDNVNFSTFTDNVQEISPQAVVSLREDWVHTKVNNGMKSLMFAIILLAGGATVLALFNLVQTYVAALIGRRNDVEILSRVGALRSQIAGVNVIEVLMILLVGSLLSAIAVYATSLRMLSSLIEMDSLVRPVLPFAIFAVMAGVCLLAMTMVALFRGIYKPQNALRSTSRCG